MCTPACEPEWRRHTCIRSSEAIVGCRVRDEILRREEVEMTKLQMSKRRRQGMVKRQTARDGSELSVARIDAKKRREGRNTRKVRVQREIDADEDDEL